MPYRDPKCVFVTNDPGLADVLVTCLGHEGIEAQVMNRATLGGLLGLTVFSLTGVSADGIEVWVKNPDDVPRALQIISAEQEARSQRTAAQEESGPVNATCEECGRDSTFAGKYRGSVQDCPHCGKYMDVPGDDGDFES